MADKILSSPYSFWENVKWPFLHAFPSLKQETKISKIPLSKKCTKSTGKTVKLLFFGDLMNMYGDEVPKCDRALQKLFVDADFIVGNLECPITSELKQQKALLSFVFQSSEEYLLEFCHNFMIDPTKLLLSVANNHMGDHGASGFSHTLEVLRKLSITPLGIQGELPFVEREGLKIGFMAATEWMNHDNFNDKQNLIRTSSLTSQKLKADKQDNGLHSLVTIPHWGREFRHFPSLLQSNLAENWCRAGVDLIIGHHSHVPMPGELFDSSLCMYGLGNFVSIQCTWPTKLCEVLEVELHCDGDEMGKISSYRIHPFYLWNREEVLPLSKLNDKLKKRCHNRIGELFDTDKLDAL